MSEAEFANLWVEHTGAIFSAVFGFASIASGFLAATYLVASTIEKALANVVVFFYTVIMLALIGGIQRHGATLMGIRDQLVSANAQWHPAVTEPQILLPLLTNSIVIGMLAIFASSLWYFFHVRRKGVGERVT